MAPVPPRVAPADPGDRSAHRRGRGRGHQRHDRLQLGPPGLRGVRLGQRPVRAGRRRSAQAGGKSRRRRGAVRDDRRHRPPLAARPGQCRDRGVPGPGPRGPYAGLALRQGSYPEGPGQVAVTDGVATLLGLEIGKTLALDGRRRTVVGIVENPRELSDEFALVSPSSAGAPDTVTVLVDADARGDPTRSWTRRATGPPWWGPSCRGQLRAGTRAGDVLRGHRLHAAGFARRHGRLRRHRAATAPPARHARCDRRDREAPSTRAAHERRSRRRGRRTDRNGRGSRTLGRGRADARARARLSPRPAQPPLGAARDDRRRRGPLCDSRRLVAGASSRPRPRHARPLGATAQAEACTPLGNRRGRADRGGNRQPRARPTETERRSSSPGSWRRSSARCSSARWRFASSPARPGTPRSRCAWRCETLPATKPAPGRHSRPSPSPSASPRRSSSSRRPRRRRQPANRPTCPTGRSACTPVQRRGPEAVAIQTPASSNEWLPASASSRQISMTRP